MKILLSWLNDYIKTGLDAGRIAEILSDLGMPCEGIEYLDHDAVIDIEVSSNRGDCLSYIGIARELAAFTGKQLKMPVLELDESQKDVTEFVDVDILEADLCSRYTARLIENVKVGPSPDWLRNRLETLGFRTVNNVVDAANYAMLETGQPPHTFDYDKINEGKIIVRKAAPGEQIVSIDGTKCDLDPQMLIIADTKGPVAIAGVMGGLHTEVNESTKNILLEDAYFDPLSVRGTSRKLSLPSDAAFRFERIVDIERVEWASKRTAQLITQLAAGKVAKGLVDAYPKKPEKKQVTFRPSRLNKLLGLDVPTEKVNKILSRLGFNPQQKDDAVICSVPSWRSDVYREADLIEEVARVYSYNKIPTKQKIEIEVVPADSRVKLIESITKYLNGCGFYECINVSFVDNSVANLFTTAGAKEHLAVKDVSVKGTNLLRQNLLGSLFSVLKTNLNAGNTPCRIFEISNTFQPKSGADSGLPIEKTKVSLVCDGSFRDLRGVIEGLIKNVNCDARFFLRPAALVWAQVGTEILINGKLAGFAGLVGKKVKDKFGFKDITPVGAEMQFQALSNLQIPQFQVKPIPRYPAINRDLSIIIQEKFRWTDIVEAIKEKSSDKLKDITFLETYRGKGIPSGQKSVTLSLQFRDEDGTLTHDAVDEFEKAIVNSLEKNLRAKLRTV